MSNLEYIVELIKRLSPEDRKWILDQVGESKKDDKNNFVSQLEDKDSHVRKMYEDIKISEDKSKRVLLSNDIYIDWMASYCSNNKIIDSYEYNNEELTPLEKVNFDNLKFVYSGIRDYADSVNIGYYAEGGGRASYYLSYNDLILKLSVFVSGGYTAEIVKKTDLLINIEDVIDFNNVITYYQNLNLTEGTSRVRTEIKK